MKLSHLVMSVVVALATSCSSISPRGLAQLSNMSPVTADPENLVVAVYLPVGINIEDGSAWLTLSAERSDTGQKTKANYVLQRKADSTDGSLKYSIKPTDISRLRTQQTLIADWQEDAEEATSGSLSVTIQGCSTVNGPADDATVSVQIKTRKDAEFVPLIRNAPLSRVLGEGGISSLKPCEL